MSDKMGEKAGVVSFTKCFVIMATNEQWVTTQWFIYVYDGSVIEFC